jgi:hypothetical protein
MARKCRNFVVGAESVGKALSNAAIPVRLCVLHLEISASEGGGEIW